MTFFFLIDINYGYFQFVKFAVLLGFVILAYKVKLHGRQNKIIFYSELALLFQTFFKITLGRKILNIINFFVGLLILLFKKTWLKMNNRPITTSAKIFYTKDGVSYCKYRLMIIETFEILINICCESPDLQFTQ